MICSDLKSPVGEIWRTMTGHDFYIFIAVFKEACDQQGFMVTSVHMGWGLPFNPGSQWENHYHYFGKGLLLTFIICEPVNFSKTPNIGVINKQLAMDPQYMNSLFFQHLGASTTMKIITPGKFDSSPLKNGSLGNFFPFEGHFFHIFMCLKTAGFGFRLFFFLVSLGCLGSIDTFIWADLSSGVTGVLSVPRLKVPRLPVWMGWEATNKKSLEVDLWVGSDSIWQGGKPALDAVLKRCTC